MCRLRQVTLGVRFLSRRHSGDTNRPSGAERDTKEQNGRLQNGHVYRWNFSADIPVRIFTVHFQSLSHKSKRHHTIRIGGGRKEQSGGQVGVALR